MIILDSDGEISAESRNFVKSKTQTLKPGMDPSCLQEMAGNSKSNNRHSIADFGNVTEKRLLSVQNSINAAEFLMQNYSHNSPKPKAVPKIEEFRGSFRRKKLNSCRSTSNLTENDTELAGNSKFKRQDSRSTSNLTENDTELM